MIFVLIKRTYNYEGSESSDRYVLAGTHEECVRRVERMITNNPKSKVRKSEVGDSWHVTPPGGSDQGFYGPHPLDLLIVAVPTAVKVTS